MNFRVFSKKQGLYTNDPAWPSNQRTTSEFALLTSGKIVEIVNHPPYDDENSYIIDHDSRNYIVEPWTGYFDSKGKRIYRGDLLLAENDPEYLAEVIWQEGAFICQSKKDPNDMMALDLDVRVWKRIIVCGNIHGVEYND